MELLLLSPTSYVAGYATRPSLPSTRLHSSPIAVTVPKLSQRKTLSNPCLSSSSSSNASVTATASVPSGLKSEYRNQRHWMVLVEAPPGLDTASKTEIVDYYGRILESVIGSEMDAQLCIYHVSRGPQYGFCCDVDGETSRSLAGLPGVSSVQPDYNFVSGEKDYSLSNANAWNLSNAVGSSNKLFPNGNTKHWLVRVAKPTVRVVTKAQMVDHFVQLLTKVMGNETDAQMCLYHVSWQFDFGFCCELDEECAKELAGIPGVLSIQADNHFDSQSKNYRGEDLSNSLVSSGAGAKDNINTKKLFVTGLSFYTSEKTLRAAFEGFGELVEVKIIMDKISKRSKGYAFLEYTTVDAARAALTEMNGKIINGWMIVVDVAKTSPPRPPLSSEDCGGVKDVDSIQLWGIQRKVFIFDVQ